MPVCIDLNQFDIFEAEQSHTPAALVQLASERGQRESNQLAERHQKMLRELHEATAAATALKADNAEKTKQLQLKEDALKSARSEAAKAGGLACARLLLQLASA